VIVSCAVTGGAEPPATKHPGLPFSPEEIANSAIGAAEAGAAIVHIHVRDPETGAGSMEPAYYREVVERIRANGVDLLINLTTGAGGRFVPGEEEPAMGMDGSGFRRPEIRVQHVEELRPDICSLDMGSMNFGPHVFINTPGHLTQMAEAIRKAGVKPELEVFDSGHLRLAKKLIADGVIDAPAMFQLCLGISWGEAATTEAMLHMRDQLPEGTLGPPSASANISSPWWRRPWCWAVMSGSGWKTICTSRAACPRPTTRPWCRARSRSSDCWARRSQRRTKPGNCWA
jgi:uncharacterized protein (DUF849 family)